MKVAILYDVGSQEWSEADVASVMATVQEIRGSLRRLGHSTSLVPVTLHDVKWLARLQRVDAVFNLCEGINGVAKYEDWAVGALELTGVPFTGCRSSAVTLCHRKHGRTMGAAGVTIATVLVGDIRDYTVLVRQAPAIELQRSVARLFERLTEEVTRRGGTVKEYQGDAVFAFWEGSLKGDQAAKACAAALALNRLGVALADDRGTWDVPGFPLRMEWALATGPVVIDSIGGIRQRAGLSMVGEAVVLAFRLEKFATDDTGPIVTCAMTRKMAGPAFRFRDLGEMHAKGFDRADHVFALEGERGGCP